MTLSSVANNLVAVPPPQADDRETKELLIELTRKVDVLNRQVGHLYERTVAMEELKDELVHIARDAMSALQIELSTMEHEFNTDEIVHLLRQLLRSTPRFIRMLERLESVDELVQELGPLSGEVMRDVVERLQAWDERGYFQLAQSLVRAIDKVAEKTSPEDLEWLADNAVPLLETAREVTRPEVLALARGAAGALAPTDGGQPAELGLFGLARSTGDRDVRRGMGMLVEALRTLGAASRSETRNDKETPLLEGAKE